MKKIFILLSFVMLVGVIMGCNKVENVTESMSRTNSNVSTTASQSTVSNSVGSSGVANSVNNEENTSLNNFDSDVKTAVVYFSATGKTKNIAEMVAEDIRADIFEIVPRDVYTNDDLNHRDSNSRTRKEQADELSRPAIKNDLSETSRYDVIYLGYPIWMGTKPRIIQTYLEKYDLSKVKIYSFCTSGSSGIEQSISDLRELYPSLNIVSGKRLNNASKEDITKFTHQN